jgi:hypothetical protein
MTLCERCESKDRETPATYIDGSWQLCDDCLSDVGEAQEQARYEAYHGASTPQTIGEQYAAAVKERRELRR